MRLPPLNLFSLQPDKVLRKVPNDRCGLAPRPSFVIKRYRAAAGAVGINVRAYILLSFSFFLPSFLSFFFFFFPTIFGGKAAVPQGNCQNYVREDGNKHNSLSEPSKRQLRNTVLSISRSPQMLQ